MAIRYVDIPLFDSYYYDMSISLEGVSYTIEMMYNSAMELYTISLYDENKNPIVLGEALVPNYPLFLDYHIQGMTGAFIMLPKEVVRDTEPYKKYPDKIHKYYDLVYVYDKKEE